MTEIASPEGKSFRAFICHTINDAGYPANDRSGRLSQQEEPHLGRLMQKIAGKATDFPRNVSGKILARSTISNEMLFSGYLFPLDSTLNIANIGFFVLSFGYPFAVTRPTLVIREHCCQRPPVASDHARFFGIYRLTKSVASRPGVFDFLSTPTYLFVFNNDI